MASPENLQPGDSVVVLHPFFPRPDFKAGGEESFELYRSMSIPDGQTLWLMDNLRRIFWEQVDSSREMNPGISDERVERSAYFSTITFMPNLVRAMIECALRMDRKGGDDSAH